MLAAGALLLLGSLIVASSVHGSAELNVPLEMDNHGYGEMTTAEKLQPVNGTFGSHKYYIPSRREKWIGAVMHCAKIGGVLTDVRSRPELEFLQDLSRKAGGDKLSFPIGAAALGENKSFVWIQDETPVGTDLWNYKQPNTERGNCAYLRWIDLIPGLSVFPCHEIPRRFICKFDA